VLSLSRVNLCIVHQGQADSYSCKQARFVTNSLMASRKFSLLLNLPSCIVQSRFYPHLFHFLQHQPNGLPTLHCFKIYFWSSSCNKSHLNTTTSPHILYVPSISLSGFTSHNSISISSVSLDTTLDTQHSFCIPNITSTQEMYQVRKTSPESVRIAEKYEYPHGMI